MGEGWVKLWRKAIDSGLIKNHNVWVFWTYCLLKANHEKDYKQVIGFQEIKLQPGQFIFGLHKASDETGLSVQKIRTCLSFLKKYKNLTIKSTNKFSIITIINWGTYQKESLAPNKQSNKQVTSGQQAGNNKQEPKNQRTEEVKKTKAKKTFVPPTENDVVLYFKEKGYTSESARKAFMYYASNNWHDSRGNKIKSWKQKMIGVWFNDENKIPVVNGNKPKKVKTLAEREQEEKEFFGL